MVRKPGGPQPKIALSEIEWERLFKDVIELPHVAVKVLCKRYGVSRARFYKKFGARLKAHKENGGTPSREAA